MISVGSMRPTYHLAYVALLGNLAALAHANSVSGFGVLPTGDQFSCSQDQPLKASCSIDENGPPNGFDTPSISGFYRATSANCSVDASSQSSTFGGDGFGVNPKTETRS